MKIKPTNFLLIAIILIGFFISFSTLKDISFHHDEIKYLSMYVKFIEAGYIPSMDLEGINFFLIPFYLIFGYVPFAVRLSQTIFLMSSIIFIYLFVKNFYSGKIAIITCLLLISFPFFSLTFIYEWPFIPFILMSFLYFAYRYYKTKRIVDISIASLIIGYGIHLKMIFLYLFLSTTLAYLFVKISRSFKSKRKISLSLDKIGRYLITFLISIIFFLIGISPYLMGNLSGGGKFLLEVKISDNFPKTSAGHDNFNLIHNVLGKIRQTHWVISGDFPNGEKYHGKVPYGDLIDLKGISIITSLLFLFSFCFFLWRREYFIPVLIISFTILSTFSPTQMRVQHILTIFPLFAIVIARPLVYLYETKKSTFIRAALIIGILFILLINFQKILYTMLNWQDINWLWKGYDYEFYGIPR